MNLIKRNPTRSNVYRPMNDLLNTFLNDNPWNDSPDWHSLPSVNMRENEDAFDIELAMPGLNKSDVKIEIDDAILSISTEFKKEETKEEQKYLRKEFDYKSFTRKFTIPESVDESKVNARSENGILYINLPKKEEAKPAPKRVIKIS